MRATRFLYGNFYAFQSKLQSPIMSSTSATMRGCSSSRIFNNSLPFTFPLNLTSCHSFYVLRCSRFSRGHCPNKDSLYSARTAIIIHADEACMTIHSRVTCCVASQPHGRHRLTFVLSIFLSPCRSHSL